MMVNWPQDLKSQETAFNRNKIEQLNLLSDKNIHVMFTQGKGKACLQNACKFC